MISAALINLEEAQASVAKTRAKRSSRFTPRILGAQVPTEALPSSWDLYTGGKGDGVAAAARRMAGTASPQLRPAKENVAASARTSREIAGGYSESPVHDTLRRSKGTIEEAMARADKKYGWNPASPERAFLKQELQDYEAGRSGVQTNLVQAKRGKLSLLDAFEKDRGAIAQQRNEVISTRAINQEVSDLGASAGELLGPGNLGRGVKRGVGRFASSIVNPLAQAEMLTEAAKDPVAAVEGMTTKNPVFDPNAPLEQRVEGGLGLATLAIPAVPKVVRTFKNLRGKAPAPKVAEFTPKEMPGYDAGVTPNLRQGLKGKVAGQAPGPARATFEPKEMAGYDAGETPNLRAGLRPKPVAEASKPASAKGGGGKEPWEMTRGEFHKGKQLHGSATPIEKGKIYDNAGFFTTDDESLAKFYADEGRRKMFGDVKEFSPDIYAANPPKNPLDLRTKEGQTALVSEWRKEVEQFWKDNPNGPPRGMEGAVERAEKAINSGKLTLDIVGEIRDSAWRVAQAKGSTRFMDQSEIPRVAKRLGHDAVIYKELHQADTSKHADVTVFFDKPETVSHKASVESALREGKPVPDEVLADYPDLAAKYGKPPKPVAPKTAKPSRLRGKPKAEPPAPVQKMEVEAPKQEAVRGKSFENAPSLPEREVTSPDLSMKVKAIPRLVEAADVIVSHDVQGNPNPRFPSAEGVQGRGRQGANYQEQYKDVVRDFQPGKLTEDWKTSEKGATIVDERGVSLAGTGRENIIQMAQRLNPKGWEAYKQMLRDKFGAEAVDRMKDPRMVLEVVDRLTPEQKAEFNRLSDIPETSQKNVVEKAKSDVDLLPKNWASKFESGGRDLTEAFEKAGNREIVDHFIEQLPSSEKTGLYSGTGKLTDAAYERVANAALADFLGPEGARALESHLGDADFSARVMKGLQQSMPDLAPVLRSAKEGNASAGAFRKDLADAMNLIDEFKKQDKFKKPRQYFDQGTMIERSERAAQFATDLLEAKSQADVKALIEAKAREALSEAEGLFGAGVTEVAGGLERIPGKRDAATVEAEIEALKAQRTGSGVNTGKNRLTRGAVTKITAEDLKIAAELGIRYVELGARKFAEWSRKMVDDFGKPIRPHLRDLYKKSHDAANDALSRLRKYVKGSKPIWRETMEARRIERGKRFGRAADAAKSAGPADALKAAKSQLGGELPDLEGPKDFAWAEGEQTELKGKIWNKGNAIFTDKLDAAEGLENIFNNKVPRPHELEAMAKFFPDDVIAGLLDLAERNKPMTLGRRLNKVSTNMALASIRARTIDIGANIVKLAAYVAQNPGRIPAGALIEKFFVDPKVRGRGRERSLWTGGKLGRIVKGAGERWKTEAERTMQGLDFDAMAKYEDNGAVARVTGLTDVPFKDFYARHYMDDAAQNLSKAGKGDHAAIFKQLTEGGEGPLLDNDVAMIQREAHDWAIRNTFNIENVASRITGALRKAGEAAGKPFTGQMKFEVQDMAKFLVNATTRFSRVIGNVALERLNYSPMPGFGTDFATGGIVEGAARLALSKLSKSPLTPEQGRMVADLFVKGTVGVGLVKLGEYLWQNGYQLGTPVETKNGTHFMDFGLLDQVGSIIGPILYGQTMAAAEDPRLRLTQKQKDAFKWDTNIGLLANQPLTTDVKKAVQAIGSSEGAAEWAASVGSRNFLPAEMRNWARAQDAYKHNMGWQEVVGGQRRVETHGFWDEIKANVPWLRETLKTAEDKRGVAAIASDGSKGRSSGLRLRGGLRLKR